VTGVGVDRAGLEQRLRSVRDAGRRALVPYVTGGLGDWTTLVEAVVAVGADAVEIGIPFSDPALDGPTIQQASAAALAAGATPRGLLGELGRLDVGVPLVVMTYYNLVHHAGHERFATMLVEAGVTATILPDLPLEACGPWRDVADDAGIENVLLVAPVTPTPRIEAIADATRGFVYCVSVMGTTGERTELPPTALALLHRVGAVTDRPRLLGFGVSRPEHARAAAPHADGVIVASALVRRVLDGQPPEEAARLVADLRSALDDGAPGERRPSALM
jgi:tryptophan synthase alpha chain